MRWLWMLTLGLCLLATTPVAATDEHPLPFVGLSPLDPTQPRDVDALRMTRLAGMGRAWVATAPIPWGLLEPEPPSIDGINYTWKVLDDAMLVWQLAGLEPVVVLSPRSPWASMKAENAAWPLALRRELPEAEAMTAQRAATGAAPPKDVTWRDWERFVGALVERYDGDGNKDMPGLRRPLRALQILDRMDTPAAWVGSPEQYLRLLNAAHNAGKAACSDIRIVAAAVDLRAIGHPPHPDGHEWKNRVRQRMPVAPKSARMELQRALASAESILSLPRLYDVFTHVGSGSHEDDVANLRYLRRSLDEAGASSVGLWLVHNPTRKLDRALRPDIRAPAREEQRIRRRWLATARKPQHSEYAIAQAWLRRGQAYDVIRSVCRARGAGADAVLFLSPWDTLPASVLNVHPGCGNQGFVRDSGSEQARTPSWYALRQMNELLSGHRGIRVDTIQGTGTQITFTIAKPKAYPWVSLLVADPKWTWAGTPKQTVPTRAVVLPMASGRYRIIPCQLSPDAPPSREVRSIGGVLRISLGPAPVYLVPVL